MGSQDGLGPWWFGWIEADSEESVRGGFGGPVPKEGVECLGCLGVVWLAQALFACIYLYLRCH